jgi:pimeloyl-ACP methyl ester carboxylesterase
MIRLSGNIYRYDLSVREQGICRGGPVVAIHGDVEVLATSLCRHILLFIHGFNDTACEANEAYEAALKYYLPDLGTSPARPDALVCFQWPGDIAVGPFKVMDAFGYPWDIKQAIESADKLATYLAYLCTAKGANFKISVVAHSMGCRLILEALKRMIPTVAASFEIIGLMAAAVPVDLVSASSFVYGGASLAGTDRFPRKTMKFYSYIDPVLALAFPAGQSMAFATRIEPGLFLEAVGSLGNPSDFGIADQRSTNNLHGQYWGDKKIETEIIAAIDPTKVTPPLVRQPQVRALPQQVNIANRKLPPPRALA